MKTEIAINFDGPCFRALPTTGFIKSFSSKAFGMRFDAIGILRAIKPNRYNNDILEKGDSE